MDRDEGRSGSWNRKLVPRRSPENPYEKFNRTMVKLDKAIRKDDRRIQRSSGEDSSHGESNEHCNSPTGVSRGLSRSPPRSRSPRRRSRGRKKSKKSKSSRRRSKSGKGRHRQGKKKHKSSSSSSSDDSSSDTSHDEERKKKRLKRREEKKRKPEKKKKKEKKRLKKEKKIKSPVKNEAVGYLTPSPVKKPVLALPQSTANANDAEAASSGRNERSLAPMTREEWERRQSLVRREVSPTTGRSRLIRGDGEVIKEIVSRQRHQDINRAATRADGNSYQIGIMERARKY